MKTTRPPSAVPCNSRPGATPGCRTANETSPWHGPFAPYWRLEDKLCHDFLWLAAAPREFEGLKHFFPFVRAWSVLGLPRTSEWLNASMRLAFMAGHDFGGAHPELLEEVLPNQEGAESLRRLSIIRHYSDEERLTFAGLSRAGARIIEAQWPKVSEHQAQDVMLEIMVKALRAGFAAGSIAQYDPLLCEFVGDIPQRTGAGIRDILSRVLLAAPLDSFGQPVAARLQHPLLTLGTELYPGQPTGRDTILAFLRAQLHNLRVQSETECPATDLDLRHWVAAALDYGHRIKRASPEVPRRIFAEQGEARLTRALVREVAQAAGGADPILLLPHLETWQQQVYGWSEPGFYGEALTRVVYYADFAIWIPWALGSSAAKSRRKGDKHQKKARWKGDLGQPGEPPQA